MSENLNTNPENSSNTEWDLSEPTKKEGDIVQNIENDENKENYDWVDQNGFRHTASSFQERAEQIKENREGAA